MRKRCIGHHRSVGQRSACGASDVTAFGEGMNDSRFTDALDAEPVGSHRQDACAWPGGLNEVAWVPMQAAATR